MTQQVVIFIHGVGDQQAGYSLVCERAIRDQLADYLSSGEQANVSYREVLWAPETSVNQARLWSKVSSKHDLDMVKLRKFFVGFAGDAVAYQRTAEGKPVYDAIHAKVRIQIDAAISEADGEDVEFTFLAHSLGSVIISNFLWDERQHFKATNLFTVGSPIALWLLRYGDISNSRDPVEVARPEGVWVNILDDEDVIAYPLREINSSYKAAVDKDYMTEIGGILSSGTPLSHVGYWDDGNVVKPVAQKLTLDHDRITSGKEFKKRQYLKFIDKLWNI